MDKNLNVVVGQLFVVEPLKPLKRIKTDFDLQENQTFYWLPKMWEEDKKIECECEKIEISPEFYVLKTIYLILVIRILQTLGW